MGWTSSWTAADRSGSSVAELTTPTQRRILANELIAYHSPIAYQLTAERTSYQSQMIPVTPYILVACAEAFLRYPEMMRRIDAACPAEEIGRAGRVPGSRINSVHLWSIANFFLVGRKAFTQFDPSLDDPDAACAVLDFWERAARAYRGDGHRQAHDAGGVIRVYENSVVDRVVRALVPVDAELGADLRRWNATLVNYLFLLYFDTRVGTGDTGPYELPDGRTLLLRDYYQLGRSHFWWSDVGAELPYGHLLAGFALDDVALSITDFGSSRTDPEDYLDRLSGFAVFTTDGCPPGELRPVEIETALGMVGPVRRAEAVLYRRIAAMDRDEMIRCGAYVYFTFLRPFAEVAGVADHLDWSVPRDLPDHLYEFLVAIGAELGSSDVATEESPDTYYLPLAEET